MYDRRVSEPEPPSRRGRAEPRDVAELRALRIRHPELAEAVDLQIELLDIYRRVRTRTPIPTLNLGPGVLARHQADARPVLRFEDIPLNLTDLRLVVRQTTDALHRHGALENTDFLEVQALGRDAGLLDVVATWYRAVANSALATAGGGAATAHLRDAHPPGVGSVEAGMLGQVLILSLRPFLARCAEVLQQSPDLPIWTHAHCALCGGEPDMAIITPAAERHLICGRCTLQWRFDSLACPFCRNSDRARITSFATTDGLYRVYACDTCRRYLKACDTRHATRPAMPAVDAIATLPLDAAAMQRGYSS